MDGIISPSSEEVRRIDAEFTPKLIGPLFSGERFIVLYGGRSSSKSWSVARSLILRSLSKKMLILCVREYMANIKNSVHRLLSGQIEMLGLTDHFRIENSVIYGNNGTEFRFAGIQNDPQAIKSTEGIDIIWCEESATISHKSWEVLIPTLFRKPDCQMIVVFNPELATDDTYKRFVLTKRPHCVVTKINYDENPWLSPELGEEAELLRLTDPDAFQNVWLGFPREILENAIYEHQLRTMQEQNRITDVPYTPLKPVDCFWDLGWRDQSACIMAQAVGFNFHVIDYMSGSNKSMIDYLKILQQKPYIYGTHFLPHDAQAKNLGTGRSIEEVMRSNGCRVRIVPRLSVNDGIYAARMMFERVWIDEVKCADLLQSLRHYAYERPLTQAEREDGVTRRGGNSRAVPLHDEHSHAADAFRMMAVSLAPPKEQPRKRISEIEPMQHGWMA